MKCRCGSEDLFSGYFGADDLAVVPSIAAPETAPGTRWTTFCNQCGAEVKTRKPKRTASADPA